MKSRKTIAFTTALAATALAVSLAAQWKAREAGNPVTGPVTDSQASGRRWIAAAGRVEPESEEVKLGSELDGKLKSVLVDEGDTVRRGQVVAVLENADAIARVALARASVREREAALARLRNGARAEEKSESEAMLREAQAQVATARAEVDRRRTLLDRGAISRSEFDLVERDATMAAARVEAAEQRLAVVRTQTRPEDLARAEAELASAVARVQEAQALLEKTYIRSPLNGRILRRYRKAGESVSSNGNTPVVALGDCRVLRVRVDVDESDVARLRIGQAAYVKADAYGDKKFTGRVVQIGEALGRKNVRTEEPTERVDTKILETLVELDAGQALPVGLRVDAFLER